MKIVLRQTVANLGRAGQVVDVSEAYARNFLLPKKLAEVATGGVINRIEQQAATAKAKSEARLHAAVADRQRLSGTTIRLTAPASSAGKLFAAIKSDQVLEELHRQYQVDTSGLSCQPSQLKSAGQHAVTLTWPDHQSIALTVTIDHG